MGGENVEENCIIALRLFGLPQQQVESVLQQAAQEGCPGLRLLSKQDEFVVCVNAKAETKQQAEEICAKWEEWFRQEFGEAVFGRDEVGLPTAALTALAQQHKLFVAADEPTGRMLEEQIGQEELARVVYDFGYESYRHPKKSQRIRSANQMAKKYPGCPVQPVAEAAHEALAASGADWAVSYSKQKGSQPAFVLVCDAKRVWLKTLAQSEEIDALAMNWLLDMLRRLGQDLPMEETVQSFLYGKAAPELPTLIETVVTGSAWASTAPVTKQQIDASAKVSEVVQDAAQKLFDEQVELSEQPVKRNGYASRKQMAFYAAMVVAIAAIAILAYELVLSVKNNN